MKITFVIPVFNERATLEPLVEGILENAGANNECRILFVDDGSRDGSFDTICALRERYPQIDVIRFRENFGKSAALAAGFARAGGDVVVTMDSDLQDSPKEIPRLIEKLEEGYDVVCGWKQQRNDPWHKTVPSRWYNAVTAWLFDLPLHDVNCGFKAYRAEVVRNIRIYGELHRLIPVFAARLGYKIGEVPVAHQPRRFGASKYGIERLPRGAMDVLSVWFLTRYRHSPGHLFGTVGFACLGMGAAFEIAALLAAAARGRTTALFAGLSGIACVIAFLLFLGLGLVAELCVRLYSTVPLNRYIAEERIGNQEES